MAQTGLRRWGWLLLLAASPVFLFPAPALTPVLLVAPLVIWAQLDREGATPLDGVLLLLGVMLLISLYASYDLSVSLPKIAGVLLGLAGYFVAARRTAQVNGWWHVMLACLAAGAGVAGLGILGTDWNSKFPALVPLMNLLPVYLAGLPGLNQGFQPNEVAGALLWVLPLAGALVAFVLRQAGVLRENLGLAGWTALAGAALAAAGLMLLTFVLTQSRSGYLGLAVALPVVLISQMPRRARWILVGALALAGIVGGLLVLQFGPAGVAQDLLGLNKGDPLSSLGGRLEIWARALFGIQDFPVTGMGMNTFRQLVHVLYPLFLFGPDVDIGHAHNEFLQAGLDLGIPGLIAFVSLYIGAFWMLREIGRGGQIQLNLKRNRHLRVGSVYLIIGLGGGLLAHLVYGLTDAVSLGAKPGILFWALLGVIAGLYRQVTRPAAVAAG